jgi:gluconokinase
MAAGIPLNDADRSGWLASLAAVIRKGLARRESGVIACSALKEAYRDVLRVVPEQVKFIYLKGGYEVILSRMQGRDEHYMKPGMLQSQFAALEEPDGVITVDIALPPDEIVQQVMGQLNPQDFQ